MASTSSNNNRVLVVGQPTQQLPQRRKEDPLLKAVLKRVPTALRCSSPEQLIQRLQKEIVPTRGPIEILDIFDHGHGGSIRLGDAILFENGRLPGGELKKGKETAEALKPLLSDTGHVRLLGCGTALSFQDRHSAARSLLIQLARILGGHRVVFGTLSAVDIANFDTEGFSARYESSLLFSSLAAIDMNSPTANHRLANIGEYRSQTRARHHHH